ncbi:MAG: DUF4340 domain-containing protein [Elusimicrobia bacterium]|nr:DUF4340 domain-containing protein [Elusimicrobiota bacterium]
MNARRLILLILALVLLIGVGRLLASRRDRPEAPSKGPVVLVPADVTLDSLDAVEMSVGKPAPAELKIVKDSSGTWRIPAATNAPADLGRLRQLVQAIQGISGEERASGSRWFSDFGLTEEAFHLSFKRKEGVAVDLWISQGRQRKSDCFARRPGEQAIYALEEDPLGKAGFFGTPNAQDLASERWADLRIFPIQPAELTDLEIAEQTKKGWAVLVEYHRAADQPAPDWSHLLAAKGISFAQPQSARTPRWHWKVTARGGGPVELEELLPEKGSEETSVHFLPEGPTMKVPAASLNDLRDRLLPKGGRPKSRPTSR